MLNTEIKVFFSWQSDLPNSTTRGLIQSSIDAVVKGLRDTVLIIADRDTKGLFGSPDIVQTIFEKINECDIFVADVSCVATYHPLDKDGSETERLKATPNPNVLVELGYAAHTLGWDNIICIMNDDYSLGGEIPFDLEHHRLTRYSLVDNDRQLVRKYLRDVIVSTILNLIENGKRVQPQFSNIKLGSYDSEHNSVTRILHSWNVLRDTCYLEAVLDDCKKLIDEINSIVINPVQKENNQEQHEDFLDECGETVTSASGEKLTIVKNFSVLNVFKPRRVTLREKDRKSLRWKVKKYYDIDLPDEFFEFGGLTAHIPPTSMLSTEFDGNPEEIEKYNKYCELSGKLAHLDIWELYCKTFENIIILPLAVKNDSAVSDEAIRIAVHVGSDSADIIIPSDKFINPELTGLEGIVYEEDFVELALRMDESANIRYDSHRNEAIEESLSEVQACIRGGINGTPQYTEDDYCRELRKYIASPTEGNPMEYMFEISELHAGECKWAGPAILLIPKKDHVELRYSVKSRHSDGNLTGVLTFTVD